MFMYYTVGMFLNSNKVMLTHNTDCLLITSIQLEHLTVALVWVWSCQTGSTKMYTYRKYVIALKHPANSEYAHLLLW